MLIVHKAHYKKAITLLRKQTQVKVYLYPSKDSLKSSSMCWSPEQSIHIGTKDRPEMVLKSIAHEYGHCLSVQRGSKTTSKKYLKYRWSFPLPRKDRIKILEEERIAWTLGFRWLRKQGLPITKHMEYCRRVLLAHHKKNLNL